MTESGIRTAAGIPILLGEGSPPSNTAESLVYIGIAAAVITTLALVVYAINRFLRHQHGESQWGLFHGLCRAHGLGRRSRLLLRRIAQYHRLRQPARLFTEPDWLDPSSGLALKFGGRFEEISELRARLFT